MTVLDESLAGLGCADFGAWLGWLGAWARGWREAERVQVGSRFGRVLFGGGFSKSFARCKSMPLRIRTRPER